MYKLVAITQKATEEEILFIGQLFTVIEAKGKIYSLPYYRVENIVTDNSIVITFGKLPRTIVSQYIEEKKFINVKHIKLPAVKKLLPSEENRQTRAAAYEQLQEVKKLLELDLFLPDTIIIREEDLPDLDSRHILMLHKITEEAEKDACFQTTRGGKLIEITNEDKKESEADITLTFQELYTIKLTMDILNVSEVTLKKRKDNDTDFNATNRHSN